ncbi:SubName: Full=Uncharacterized protein {ECO:0000313/EMBL:CCA73879.1} [Serendipita indica DSM 11827]|nr:SubName: Full=Uncharacterized protein {ECO:0000313/EMBL:CCA73879.1} [Serendipita indica DSM 11827]
MQPPRRVTKAVNYAEPEEDELDLDHSDAETVDVVLEGSQMNRYLKTGEACTTSRPEENFVSFVDRGPSEEELAEARREIKSGETKLAKLAAKHAKLSAQLKEIEEEQEQVKEEIAYHQSIATKMRRFPHEVLSLIFEQCIEVDENFSPWTLMQVSRAWRSVAMHTRPLWSRIVVLLENRDAVPRKGNRREDGGEICDTVARLQRALARSAGGPLKVAIRGYGYAQTFYGDSKQTVLAMLNALKMVHDRIESLETTGAVGSWMEELPFDDWTFMGLRTAKVNLSLKKLNERIQQTAPNLRSLELPSGAEESNWDLSRHRVEELNISSTGTYPSDAAERGKRILDIVNKASIHLTSLDLQNTVISSANREPALIFPNLRSLVLQGVHFHRKLSVPHLETLKMSEWTKLEDDATPLDVPSLRLLSITRCMRGSCGKIMAPKVQEVELACITTNGRARPKDFIQEFLEEGNMAPTVLTLRGCDTTDMGKEYAKVLDTITTLEDLSFSEMSLSKEFFEGLAGITLATKVPAARKKPICPQLRKFHISLVGVGHVGSERAMQKWASKAVKARARRGYALEEALIQDPKESTWSSLR